MSKDLQTPPNQSEEVDLGQLFKMIGKTFDNLFKLIANIIKKSFLGFVWLIFFIKSHIIKIVIGGIIGFAFGFYRQSTGEPIYKSTTVLKQNYDTGENLYRLVDYYNELIAEADTVTLGSVLSIDPKKAASMIQLEIEPVVTQNEKLEDFDEYTKGLDSIIASTITFESYVKNSRQFDYPVQRVILKAKKQDIFGTVVSNIVNKITSTDYFLKEQKKDLAELENLEKSILESLDASNELQSVYKKVLESPLDSKNSPQTSIRIDNTEDKSITKEFELYNNDIDLRRELVSIQRRKEDKQYIVEVVSSQENQGTLDNTKEFLGLSLDFKVYYALVFMILVFLILLGLYFVKFIEKYKNTI